MAHVETQGGGRRESNDSFPSALLAYENTRISNFKYQPEKKLPPKIKRKIQEKEEDYAYTQRAMPFAATRIL